MMKVLAGLKKPLMLAVLALIVVPHVVVHAPAKLTRPVMLGPTAYTMTAPPPAPTFGVPLPL